MTGGGRAGSGFTSGSGSGSGFGSGFGSGSGDEDIGFGAVPLTDAQARRLRATTRFGVGDGVRLRGINPRRPDEGGAVVVLDHLRRARGVAVITDLGPDHGRDLFALYAPATVSAVIRVQRSLAELWDQNWLLVDCDLQWNEVVDILSHSTISDLGEFENAFLVIDPHDGRRISMLRFEAPPDPSPLSAAGARPAGPVAVAPSVGPAQGAGSRSIRPVPVADTPRSGDIVHLRTAITVLASVKQAYAAYECDYQRVLAAPALSDVQEDDTGTFVEAFCLAVALEPERPELCPPGHAARFIEAVTAAEAAWETAEANANRLGITGYDPVQRSQIRRARLALDRALRADTPAGEREASLSAARRLLEGLVVLPVPLENVIARAISGRPFVTRPALE